MVSINLAIGPSCFVRCRGCYNYFGNTANSGQLVTHAELIDFLPAAASVGITQATISGGDPLTHPEIIDIVRDVAALGLRVKLDTVGTALLDEAPLKFYGKGMTPKVDVRDFVPHLHTLGLPVDGATEESLASFRIGRPHLMTEVLRTIAVAKNAGLRVSINTVAHRHNIDELKELMQMLVDEGADEWQIFEFQPTGPLGSRVGKHLELAPGEFHTATTAIAKRCADLGLPLVCKGRAVREGLYFMVDDAGIAWTPAGSGDVRTIIGHITRDRGYVLERLHDHVIQRTRRTA